MSDMYVSKIIGASTDSLQIFRNKCLSVRITAQPPSVTQGAYPPPFLEPPFCGATSIGPVCMFHLLADLQLLTSVRLGPLSACSSFVPLPLSYRTPTVPMARFHRVLESGMLRCWADVNKVGSACLIA